MKQFSTIYKYELMGYLKSKAYIITTLLLVVSILATTLVPVLIAMFAAAGGKGEDEKQVMLLSVGGQTAQVGRFERGFAEEYEIKTTDEGVDAIRQKIDSGEAACAFVLHSATDYTYYVGTLKLYEDATEKADEILQRAYIEDSLQGKGVSPEMTATLLDTEVTHEVETIGKDQRGSFLYAYAMVFALYMVILLYGQMVATNVASEKSSRAMELLITSATPNSMMFGKVLATCTAGVLQLIAVFGCAVLLFQPGLSLVSANQKLTALFQIPPGLLFYLIVFFLLGFLLYACLFGALGSLVSRLEDLGSVISPFTMLVVIGFMVAVFSMSSGEIDNVAMRVCSYIPFTSPFAMFARIAMGTVAPLQIAISIALLGGTVALCGVFSAKLYRIGVLLYGNPPKLGQICKLLVSKS